MIPIFFAVDTASMEQAATWLTTLGDMVDIKLGLEFFIANGPAACQHIRNIGTTRRRQLFLDLKLHDIPITVGSAIRATLPLEPDFISVHTSGGVPMMQTAAATIAAIPDRPKLLGVTVLTSLETDIGTVIGRAADAKLAGLDGAICSPHEVRALRYHVGNDFFLMTPGISPAPDHKRGATIQQAMEAGADGLVIGRLIRDAPDPVKLLRDAYAYEGHRCNTS